MHFKVVPVDQKVIHGQVYRGPSYLKWRFGAGYDWKWSMKCFGGLIPIAVVATDRRLPVRGEDLRSWGINTHWIDKADNPREKIHRLLGVVFSMQAGIDRPDIWMGRDIYLGETGKLPAYDKKMQWQEQEEALPRFGEWVWRGRFWVSEITGRVLPVITGGALPATDAFTSESDQTLTAYSASWTNNGSSVFTVRGTTDDVVPNTGANTDSLAHWNADTFNDNQYAQVKITGLGANDSGSAVRVAASAMTGYVYSGNSAASYLAEYLGGAYTQLGANAAAVAVNDVVKNTANGTTITPNKNGSTTGTPGAQTDASISTGSGGIYGYSNTDRTSIDDWEGGNVSVAGRTTKNTDPQTLGVFAGTSRRTTNTP